MSDSFFADRPRHEPEEPEPRPAPPWAGPPDGTVPAIVPLERVVARSASVAIALTALEVYPAGLVLELVVMAARPLDRDRNLLRLFHDPWADATTTAGRLRLGARLSDGTRVVADDHADLPDRRAPAAVLQSLGGGGNDRRHAARYWLWPLPTGPWALVLLWPANDIPETRVELAAAEITAASTRAQVLFVDSDPPADGTAAVWRLDGR